MDIRDLCQSIKTGNSAAVTAQFLWRTIGEVQEKAAARAVVLRVMKSAIGPPMTLGNAAAAGVRLIGRDDRAGLARAACLRPVRVAARRHRGERHAAAVAGTRAGRWKLAEREPGSRFK